MSNTHITLKRSAFLPCYHHLIDSNADIDFLYGGRDSGKSRFIASILIYCCINLPYFRCVLTRKVYATILGSQFQLIKDVCQEWGIDHLFKFVDKGCKIVCLANGNYFEGRGMDDPGKLKSFSNPSHCWAEEMSDFTLTDFIVIVTSLRYNDAKVKLWCSFNPEVDGDYTEHWLYKTFFNRPDPYAPYKAAWKLGKKEAEQSQETIVISDQQAGMFEEPTITQTPSFQAPDVESFTYQCTHTTYHDNKYCRPERRAILEAMQDLDPYYYQVYTLGRWGRRKLNDPFAFCYSVEKHKRPATFNPNLEVILSFDFNRNPITCGVYQHDLDDGKVWGIECIQLATSDIYKLLDRIKVLYGNELIFVTGDATGNNTSALVEDGKTYFVIIQQELELLDTQIKVPKTNPVVKENRVLFNACLKKLDIALDPVGCQPLHFDLQNVAVNEVGDIDKGSRTNPKKRADHLDHFRYYLNTFWPNVLRK